MFQLCFNLSRIHDSVANSHALSFDPGLNEFAAKMFKELKLSAKRWSQELKYSSCVPANY